MQLNPSEISELIKNRIEGFEATSEARSEGTIVSLSDPTLPARSGGYFGDLQSLIETDILGALARS
mgnify:CR=1 FL=1